MSQVKRYALQLCYGLIKALAVYGAVTCAVQRLEINDER